MIANNARHVWTSSKAKETCSDMCTRGEITPHKYFYIGRDKMKMIVSITIYIYIYTSTSTSSASGAFINIPTLGCSFSSSNILFNFCRPTERVRGLGGCKSGVVSVYLSRVWGISPERCGGSRMTRVVIRCQVYFPSKY